MKVALALLALLAAQAAAQERAFATTGCVERVPGPVTDLSATPKGPKAITVAWNAPNGDVCVDSYSYVVYEKGAPEPRSIAPRSSAYSVTIKDLKPDTEYVVKVTAVNSLKGNGPAATVTVKTNRRCPAARPGVIGNVYVNQPSNTAAWLSWLEPTTGGCTDSYKVEGFDNRNQRVLNAQTVDPSVKATGLQPGKEYTFRITPINNHGQGDTKRVTYKTRQVSNVVASGSIPAGRRLAMI